MNQARKVVLGVLGAAILAVAGHVAYGVHALALAKADLRAAEAEQRAEQTLDYAATITGEVRLAEWRADQAEARADRAERRAQVADRRSAKSAAKYAAAPVPDTCKALKAAADSALADAQWTADSWRSAYNERTEQAAQLATAKDSAEAGRQAALKSLADLTGASKQLRKAAKPSLLARITPKVGIGVAAGVDVLQRPNAVVGVTFGWTFR